MSLNYCLGSLREHIFYLPSHKQYLEVSESDVVVLDRLALYGLSSPETHVSGILGIVKSKNTRFLIVATKHEVVGLILGKEIAKVTAFEIHRLAARALGNEDKLYLLLLRQHLTNATLYFSPGGKFDLTNSLQRQAGTGGGHLDDRFWWNKFICEDLINSNARNFLIPVIYGYVKAHSVRFNGNQRLEFALVTRRSCIRAGTRYFRRGIDESGAVANFNETEQILSASDGIVYSFLQTRGSVPVYWSEINNLKYKPDLVISSRPSQDATKKHFEEQIERYGDNYLVNLVNQSGYEKPVKEAYEKAVEMLPETLASRINYIYFDFHHECKNMRWDRVKILIERLISLGFTSDNYFAYDTRTNSVVKTQKKIVRTNCMDCLDRTNVVQSMLGRWVLQSQLEQAGYLPANNVTPWEIIDPQFNLFFQSFWADNADAVSCAYSGTGALKTDYTRTGQRTKVGALKDLVNSITRYYLNNYKDGLRQDSYDLFLGIYRPRPYEEANPFVDKRSPYTQMVPYLIGASFFILIALLIYPSGSVTSFRNLFFISGCFYFGVRNLFYVLKNGPQFVNWPKLSPLDYLKKTDVYNLDGKFVGIQYEETEDFKTSKKLN